MSKQKIILFIFLLILLVSGVLFYLFIKKESKVEVIIEPNKEILEVKTREEILSELEKIKKPTNDIIIPNQEAEYTDIKTDAEIEIELDSYKKEEPKKTEPKKSNQEILNTLRNN